jgi:hypothetical protein
MNKPHIHAAVIKAWADGAEIELRVPNTCDWRDADAPTWSQNYQYRVKIYPKPDVVRYGKADCNYKEVVSYLGPVNERLDNNLMLTFDGETGELILAEVMK